MVGEIRFKNYDCHFKSYEAIKKISDREEATQEEKSMFIDSTIKSFLYFYHKSYGEYKNNIYEMLHNYFQTMDISPCEKNYQKYEWWNEYSAIKNGNIQEVEKEFLRNNKKRGIKEYFKTCKEYGLYSVFYTIFANIIFKFYKKI